jgi:hypothetical protein
MNQPNAKNVAKLTTHDMIGLSLELAFSLSEQFLNINYKILIK